MKKVLAIFATVVLSGIMSSASAGDFGDFRTKLNAARASLVDMTVHKDRRGEDQQKVVKETADAVSVQLAKMKAPAGKEAQFKELVDTWNAFKETREKELVPAILKGDDKLVKSLSLGIQKERLAKCITLSKQLGN